MWNMFFVLGILIGGFVGGVLLKTEAPIELAAQTIEDIKALGVHNFDGLIPTEIFNWENLLTVKGFIILVGGSFLIGFGARYAGGCTSGHAIMGISSLQWPSLVTVIFFFIGGLLMTHIIAPLIYQFL